MAEHRAPGHRVVAAALYALAWVTLAFVGRSLGVAAGEGDAIGAALAAAHALGGATPPLPPAGGPPPASISAAAAALGWLLGGRLVDGLTALRLGLAALTALAPPFVFLLARRSLGPAPAVLAALLTLFHPRWLLGASTLHGEGAFAALAVATLWAYDRFLVRPGRGPAAALGLAFGAAFVSSPAALMLPAAVVMQGAWPSANTHAPRENGHWKRLGFALAAMAVGALGALGFFAAAARALRLAPVLWASERGAPPAGTPTLSTAQALALPWVSAPASTAVLAIAGAASFVWLAWRHPARARPLVAAAAVAAFLATRPLTWPGPHAFGREGALMPLVGLFAALGAQSVALALRGRPRPFARTPDYRAIVFALALAGPWWASLHAPATLSASFSSLAGGPARAAHARSLPLHDGSPVGGLAGALEALDRPELLAYAPEVPADAWVWMRLLGRLRTRVRPAPDPGRADVEVRTGGEPPTGAVALVRDGQAVVSLRALGAAPARPAPPAPSP